MAKATKKKSAKEATNTFHSIMKASVTFDNAGIYLKAYTEYWEIVKDKPISKDLKNDIIKAIAMEGNSPIVVSVNKHDGTLIKTPLETWLSHNGY